MTSLPGNAGGPRVAPFGNPSSPQRRPCLHTQLVALEELRARVAAAAAAAALALQEVVGEPAVEALVVLPLQLRARVAHAVHDEEEEEEDTPPSHRPEERRFRLTTFPPLGKRAAGAGRHVGGADKPPSARAFLLSQRVLVHDWGSGSGSGSLSGE